MRMLQERWLRGAEIHMSRRLNKSIRVEIYRIEI